MHSLVRHCFEIQYLQFEAIETVQCKDIFRMGSSGNVVVCPLRPFDYLVTYAQRAVKTDFYL